MSQHISDDITKVGIQLILEEPFYGHLFSSLLRTVDENIETVSLSVEEKQIAFSVNPQYWKERIDFKNLKYGILKHQLLHLALKHPFLRKNYKHQNIFDIAADLVVNQYINAIHLPDDAITLESHSDFKQLDKLKGVNYYYLKLLEIQKKDENQDNPLPKEGHSQLQQHSGWNNLEQINPLEQRIIEGALEEAMVQAAERSDEKSIGNLPTGLQVLIKEKLYPNQSLDWKRVLRIFLGTGKKTYLKNTLRRPSKRYGTTPGIQIKHRKKVLVGIDTSGSISPDELSIFFGEIQQIQRQGAEIMVAECDAALQRTYLLKKTYPKEVKGGGGTDFAPLIQFANEEYRPDVIVYFTDGYANPPAIRPKSPILWMISKEGIKPESETWKALEGRKVKMN